MGESEKDQLKARLLHRRENLPGDGVASQLVTEADRVKDMRGMDDVRSADKRRTARNIRNGIREEQNRIDQALENLEAGDSTLAKEILQNDSVSYAWALPRGISGIID